MGKGSVGYSLVAKDDSTTAAAAAAAVSSLCSIVAALDRTSNGDSLSIPRVVVIVVVVRCTAAELMI